MTKNLCLVIMCLVFVLVAATLLGAEILAVVFEAPWRSKDVNIRHYVSVLYEILMFSGSRFELFKSSLYYYPFGLPSLFYFRPRTGVIAGNHDLSAFTNSGPSWRLFSSSLSDS